VLYIVARDVEDDADPKILMAYDTSRVAELSAELASS
jgi:hypothetical protein